MGFLAIDAMMHRAILAINYLTWLSNRKVERTYLNKKMENEQGIMVGGAMMVPSKNIVENAMNADNVTTLVAAVKAAGLVAKLEGPGPFTVFAPTDAAFAKIPSGTVETLLKPENKEKLAGILTYHVVSGAWKSSDLKDGKQEVATVNGQKIVINKKDGKVWVNDAEVEIADVISKNGVTHVINRVLLPK